MKRVLVFALATIVLGVAGFYVGLWLFDRIASGELAVWSSLGKPPGGAVRFLRAEYYDEAHQNAGMNVETTSGAVYHCCRDGRGEWEQGDPSGPKFPSNCQADYDPSKHPAFSNLRGRVIDCAAVYRYKQWVRDADIFAILEDGSVWKWHHYSSPGSALVLLLLTLGGTPLLMIALGWIIIVIIMRARKGKQV